MTIIGLTGGIGHGKTTFAADLASCATSYDTYESSGLISEVANQLRENNAHPSTHSIDVVNQWIAPLPGILKTCVHVEIPFSQIELTSSRLQEHPDYYEKLFEYLVEVHEHPEKSDHVITPENKAEYRPLLQWLGGYLAKVIDGGIWYREIVTRIQAAPPVELAVVGGVRFPADAEELRKASGIVLEVVRPQHRAQDTADVTERERSLIVPDVVVYNDGTLAQLTAVAKEFYDDLVSKKLQVSYSAKKH